HLKQSDLTPLEKFLFIRKQGHCEWFASSTAVLFRLAGLPARLVAGFLVTRAPMADILTVRSGDAHAWVEVWFEGVGWVPIDTTPKVLGVGSFLDFLSDSYEILGAYWSKYV